MAKPVVKRSAFKSLEPKPEQKQIDFVFKSGSLGGALYVDGELVALSASSYLSGWQVLKALGIKYTKHWLNEDGQLVTLPKKLSQVKDLEQE